MGRKQRVWVVCDRKRDCFLLRWHDEAERIRERTSDAETVREAEAEAARWARELERQVPSGADSWHRCIAKYEATRRWRKNTWSSWRAALKALYLYMEPRRVGDLDKHELSKFYARELDKKRPDTVRSYKKRIEAFLEYCREELEVIDRVPKIKVEKSAERAKGRAITGEEWDRMLAAAEARRPRDYPLWQAIMASMYYGGLRLSEATKLRWDWDADFAALYYHDPPLLYFSTAQKNGQESRLPMPAEFVELCEHIGPKRTGRVFAGLPSNPQRVGTVICEIGKAAGIIVNSRGKTASSHDLRRSFGTRWAKRLKKPIMLMKLMRHTDLKTTMDYYVNIDLQDLHEELNRLSGEVDFGGTFGGTTNSDAHTEKPKDKSDNDLGESGRLDLNQRSQHPQGDQPES